MAPLAKEIEEALLDSTFEVWTTDPDNTTVNKVRKHAEEKLDLEEGFLSSTPKWKAKSKTLIKGRVEKLADGWVPEKEVETSSKVGPKRRSSKNTSPAQKRRKAPKKVEFDSSELTEPSEEEEPRPKKKRATASRRSKKPVSDDEDELSEAPQNESPKPQSKNEAINVLEEDADKNEDNLADSGPQNDEKALNNAKQPVISLGDAVEDSDQVTTNPLIDEEEEYSDVIDEPPKPKRKKKEKKEKKERPSMPAKASKAAAKKASVPDDPQEAEIKKLQSQLVKCGIRKLWHNELKKYGDDSRAKIRHLKKMLSDVGMDGRFSEAKAREIKETRELLGEVEDAQEMNRLWGMDNSGRASRSKSKTTTKATVEEENGADDDDDEEEDNTYAARRRKAHADIAFLGDDSDSD